MQPRAAWRRDSIRVGARAAAVLPGSPLLTEPGGAVRARQPLCTWAWPPSWRRTLVPASEGCWHDGLMAGKCSVQGLSRGGAGGGRQRCAQRELVLLPWAGCCQSSPLPPPLGPSTWAGTGVFSMCLDGG